MRENVQKLEVQKDSSGHVSLSLEDERKEGREEGTREKKAGSVLLKS